jgi:RND family efflux transporter MFP subunit
MSSSSEQRGVHRKMKKRRILIITICVVIVGIVLGIVLTRGTGSEDTPDTAVVTRGDIAKTVLVDGSLEMPNKAYLSFGATGTVEEVLVEEGNNVTKDQVLAKLEARSLELNVEVAQAQYETAQINLIKTIYPYYTTEEGTDMPGVWLALEEAQDNLKQAQELLNEGKVKEAQAVLNLIEGNLGKAEEKSIARTFQLPWEVKLLELQVDIAKANLDSAKLNLEKTVIVAPFDGVVADIAISEGEDVSTATLATPAISLVDTSEIKMSGFIDELDIAMVQPGQEVNILLDALPDEEVKGEVTFISPIGTTLAGVVSYETTITLENPVGGLKDGMSATAEVIIERRDDVLSIPNRAIRGTTENPMVVVLIDGQQEEREITLGLTDGINSEVLSGLEEGEKVIIPTAKERQNGFFTM